MNASLLAEVYERTTDIEHQPRTMVPYRLKALVEQTRPADLGYRDMLVAIAATCLVAIDAHDAAYPAAARQQRPGHG